MIRQFEETFFSYRRNELCHTEASLDYSVVTVDCSFYQNTVRDNLFNVYAFKGTLRLEFGRPICFLVTDLQEGRQTWEWYVSLIKGWYGYL